MSHPCLDCGAPTVYQSMSGGREYWCETCQSTGEYPQDGPELPRAALLRTPEGREELRRLMREEIARRNRMAAPEGEAR